MFFRHVSQDESWWVGGGIRGCVGGKKRERWEETVGGGRGRQRIVGYCKGVF